MAHPIRQPLLQMMIGIEKQLLLLPEQRSSEHETRESPRQRWNRWLRTPRSWLAALAVHSSMIAITSALLFLISKRLVPDEAACANQRTAISSSYNPANRFVRYKVDVPPADYWNNMLYMGEPTYTSDYMWNDLMDYQGLRLEKEEGERLNISAAPLPNGGYATMFGVFHNLHCLRRIRQHLFEDYYYPNRTAEEREEDVQHNYHCLEAVRTSIMCHPDLTPHPLRWAKSLPNHPLVANPNVERECVDWDYLHEFVKTRKYHLPQVLEGMRETGQKMPGSES